MAGRLDLGFRDALIEQYFKLGYNHAEILLCLLLLLTGNSNVAGLELQLLRWPNTVCTRFKDSVSDAIKRALGLW